MAFVRSNRVLVTGGAGYLGSHLVLKLAEMGLEVTVVDNCERGHVAAIESIRVAVASSVIHFVHASLHETERLATIMKEQRIDAVFHMAALAYVAESVERPLEYWATNVDGTTSLLRAMEAAKVGRLIFSSSCATYGSPSPTDIPIRESCEQVPISPYGKSKAAAELAIRNHHIAATEGGVDFSYTIMRCFNVIGNDPHARIGEDHRPESHLVPSCLLSILGRRGPVTILGDDYPTPDGTCIRDYLDVNDLCDAHIAALDALTPRAALCFNVGRGHGHSILEVVRACERVCGHGVATLRGPRRIGDPPLLIADSTEIKRVLHWSPKVQSLEESISHTWKWLSTHPHGYDAVRMEH